MSPHPRPQSNYIDDPGGLEDPTPLLQETTNPLFGPLSYQNDRDVLGGSDLTSAADPTRQNFITKMSTEFFALPGLPPLPSGRPGSIDDLVGSGEGRGPRQMCPDWGSTKCLEDLVTNKTLVTSPGGGHGGLGAVGGVPEGQDEVGSAWSRPGARGVGRGRAESAGGARSRWRPRRSCRSRCRPRGSGECG